MTRRRQLSKKSRNSQRKRSRRSAAKRVRRPPRSYRGCTLYTLRQLGSVLSFLEQKGYGEYKEILKNHLSKFYMVEKGEHVTVSFTFERQDSDFFRGFENILHAFAPDIPWVHHATKRDLGGSGYDKITLSADVTKKTFDTNFECIG